MSAKSVKSPSNFLNEDRLFPSDPNVRNTAREIFEGIENAPLLSPHGHCQADWFLPEFKFGNAAELLIVPDHYLLRMLLSQGISYEELGVAGNSSEAVAKPRDAFRTFSANYYLFRGTPSRLWMDHALYDVLGVSTALTLETADRIYDEINEKLAATEFSPYELLERFGVEVLSTTDEATASLEHHKALSELSDMKANILPTFRPDALTDPENPNFATAISQLAKQTGRDIGRWADYLNALRDRRAFFISHGATATDHGFPTARTLDLPEARCQELLDKALSGACTAAEADEFRAQLLFEMARMSTEDGLIMQIHAGARRNYSPEIFRKFGLDKGFDIPSRSNWADELKPLLDAFGFDRNLRVVLYTLDETAYARELAPLAGAFPILRLGASWWFFDSERGMKRYLEEVRETAGYYNMAGFVDDTRALLSIPGRHDVYRRCLASHLAEMVATHQINAHEAVEIASDLTGRLVRETYNLPE